MPLPFYLLRERAPGTHWIEGCVVSRSCLDPVEKRKILHCRYKNSSVNLMFIPICPTLPLIYVIYKYNFVNAHRNI
jgi:hypothetical protein